MKLVRLAKMSSKKIQKKIYNHFLSRYFCYSLILWQNFYITFFPVGFVNRRGTFLNKWGVFKGLLKRNIQLDSHKMGFLVF